MPTSRSYAYDKFYMGTLLLATTEGQLRERITRAVIDHVRHAQPPYEAEVPSNVAKRADEFFALVRRGPQVDEDEALIKQTFALMTEAELQQAAAEMVWIYGQLNH